MTGPTDPVDGTPTPPTSPPHPYAESGPSSGPPVGRPGKGSAPRPLLYVLAGVSLFVAGGLLGAILMISITFYRAPTALPVPTVTVAIAATVAAPNTVASLPAATLPPPASTRPAVGPNVGQEAPSFTLVGVDGNSYSLSAYHGRTVLVNFWATWCPPCRQEWPELLAFAQQIDPLQVAILAVNSEEDPGLVQSFVGTETLPFPVLLDGEGTVGDTYRVTGLPTTFLVSPEGVVLQVIPGNLDLATFQSLVGK